MPCRVFLRSTLLLAAFAGAVLFLSPAVSSQTPPSVTFQVEVNFVDIDAVVTDERGNFIGDLRREDFELLEDGKPQPISTFSLVDITPSRSAAVCMSSCSTIST